MSKLSCEEARELAPELALGVIAGDERARVLGHIASCASCRRFVEDLAEVADSILLLAPEHEPAAGFESNVLARMRGPVRPRGRLLAAAAALLLAAGAAAGSVWWATADDRSVASHYRHALAEADGKYFGVHAVMAPDGTKLGNVFVYTGDTDWLFVVFDEGIPTGAYAVKADMENTSPVNLRHFELTGDERTWGRNLDIDLREVSALRFRAPDDRVLIARF
jgi:hypothetical protein